MNAFDPRLTIIAAEARVKTCHVFHCWQAMKEMGKSFHRTAFATFAGLEERHVDAILASLEAHEALPAGRAMSTKGTRLPLDWAMPDDWQTYAMTKRGWHPDDIAVEAEKFANHWQAKSGNDACKLNWLKTWQNWVLGSHRPDGNYKIQPDKPVVPLAESMARTADLYDRMGRTTEAQEIRRRLAEQSNVIPFSRGDEKIAVNGG